MRPLVYRNEVTRASQPSLAKAILTDSHLWVPVVVLSLGIGLLFFLR